MIGFCQCGKPECQPCWIQREYPGAVPPVQIGPFRGTLEKPKRDLRKTACARRTEHHVRHLKECGACRVYGCSAHGECTVGRNTKGLRNCLDCPDYATWPIRFDEGNLARGKPGKRFNASITHYGDAYLLAYRDGWGGSNIWTIQLDRAFRPVGEPVMANMRLPWSRERKTRWLAPGCNFGREDPRLFWHKGRLHLAFIGWTGGVASQCFARLRDDRTVEDAWQVNIPNRRDWEKNHSFFDHDGDLYAVYLTHPFHLIAKIDCERAEIVHQEANPFPWSGGELRGGAPPVRVGDEFWSFIHDRIDINGMPTYRMMLYTFDAAPPFAPRRMIREPLLVADLKTKPPGVACCVFPCGAVRVGDDWIVSMGVHDRWIELRTFSHADLDSRLETAPAPRLPATFAAPPGLVSVTIGIGDKFKAMAEASAASVRKFYGVEHSIILDERHLESCPPRHLFKDSPRQIFWLKWMVAKFFPNVERWVYHDADLRIVREPDAAALAAMRTDPRLIAVRDWWTEAPTDPYFNAGFMVCNRSHDALFEWCMANYWKTPETYGEQCVLNAGIKALGVPVLEFHREFNAGKPGQCEIPVAVHGYWSP